MARTDPPADLALLPVAAAWNLDLNNAIIAAPAFKDERGYFPLEGQRLAAYDIRHGTLLWVAAVHAQWRPAIGGDLVFVAEPDGLTALYEDTGAVKWRVPLAEGMSAPLVWTNGWLLATGASGTVRAFRASDGGVLWSRPLAVGICAPAAVAADRVYVALVDGRVVALQLETGETVWERRLGGPPSEILALERRLFVGSTDNYFYAIQARDGEVLWRWPTGADVIGLPAVDARHVYFVSLDNVLRALDRNNGAQRWKRALPIRPTRGPVAAGQVLIMSGVSPNAPAFHMKDGTPAGSLAASGELAAAPYVLMGPGRPEVILVSRDLARGTVVRNLIRSVEPKEFPLAPLLNPIVPSGPTPPYEVPLVPLPDLLRPEGPYEWTVEPLSDPTIPEFPTGLPRR